ncbi:hypothetical protein AVEN_199655-1 [Araneus ventricosus]|uniref:Uncharacterized protein n=1 Tax=Araneus ventricosus TaxID=182803 RepID=A0A4Y2DGQ3_ARAVE|nr:hypothetical protein AVEN_199655-1 [Araneus ventricosus]
MLTLHYTTLYFGEPCLRLKPSHCKRLDSQQKATFRAVKCLVLIHFLLLEVHDNDWVTVDLTQDRPLEIGRLGFRFFPDHLSGCISSRLVTVKEKKSVNKKKSFSYNSRR